MLQEKTLQHGTFSAVAAYLIWGLFPIYWKWLDGISALQLVSHRILWTCVLLCGFLVLSGHWTKFFAAVKVPGIFKIYLYAAVLMSINWQVFILAVNSSRVTETSLGYFISPLISVLMGVVLFHERLRPWQWFSVWLAIASVLYLTLIHGSLPWMALALAFSFGTYGLVKKIAALGSVYGLALETIILTPIALTYLVYCEFIGQGVFLHTGTKSTFLLIGTGVVSMFPLLLFSSAAQRIPLSRLGVLQYITPIMQFLLGTLIYKEPFGFSSLLGFSMVWIALTVFVVEGVLVRSSLSNGAGAAT